jgi:hypothetical protein
MSNKINNKIKKMIKDLIAVYNQPPDIDCFKDYLDGIGIKYSIKQIHEMHEKMEEIWWFVI